MAEHDLTLRPALQRLALQRHDGVDHGEGDGEGGALQMLQRTAGNAAVAAELQREEGARSPVLDVVGKGGGRPLDSSLRTDMEGRFGTDFGHVRVHDDPVAQRSATDVGARAYTTGHEVVLGEGVSLGSAEGQHTLAHELTHVLQQGQGPVAGTSTGDGVSVSDPGDHFEQEAESTAHAVLGGGVAPAHLSGGGEAAGAVQREEVQRQAVQREGEGVDDEEQLSMLRIQREEMPEDEEIGPT